MSNPLLLFGAGSTTAGATLTLADPAGGDGPIGFDDQLVGHYAEAPDGTLSEITASSASAQTITVADGSAFSTSDLIAVRLNSSGDELIYLEHPSNFDTYGLYRGTLERADIPDVQNLLSDVADAYLDTDTDADGLADGWNEIGTPTTTMDTDAANHKHGTGSQKVVASAGEGIKSDPITVDPTAERPYFAAEGRVKADSGTVQIHIVDTTVGARLHPKLGVDAGKTPSLNTIEAITSAPGVNFDDLGTTQVEVWFVARGGSSTFWVDAAQLTQQQVPVGTVEEGRGANALWQAANNELANRSSPEDRWDIDPIDLYRADTSRWPDQQIDLGQTVIVKDTGLNTDAELRVVARERDLLVPGRVSVTVDHRPKTLAERINPSQIDQLFDDQPASSGADPTAGSQINELNINFGTLTATAPPGMHARVGSMASDATFSGSMSTAGEIRVAPFSPTQTFTVQSIKLAESTVSASGTARVAIYSDEGFYPDTLLYESGDLTLDGDGTVFDVSGPIIEMEAGNNYWIGAQITVVTSGTPALRIIAAGDPGTQAALGFDGTFTTEGFQALSSTGNGSTVPDVFPASATAVNQMLWVELEAPS